MILRPTLFALALGSILHSTNASACDLTSVTIEATSGSHTFGVEIADDSKERAEGLSGRDILSPQSGMLFLYEDPHRALFWMMGMKIALDMIFIESDGRISAIQSNVQPGTLWPVSGGKNVIAVLEINAGEAERQLIKAGDRVQHPAFGDPCR